MVNNLLSKSKGSLTIPRHVRGHKCVGIFAIRDIRAGEEVTFDYQYERVGRSKQKCYCGKPLCRGFLGARKVTLPKPEPKAPPKAISKGKNSSPSRKNRNAKEKGSSHSSSGEATRLSTTKTKASSQGETKASRREKREAEGTEKEINRLLREEKGLRPRQSFHSSVK
jgi:hypothetical protein